MVTLVLKLVFAPIFLFSAVLASSPFPVLKLILMLICRMHSPIYCHMTVLYMSQLIFYVSFFSFFPLFLIISRYYHTQKQWKNKD